MPGRAEKTQGIAVWAVGDFVDVFSVFDSYALPDEPHACRSIVVSTVSPNKSIEEPPPSRNFIFVSRAYQQKQQQKQTVSLTRMNLRSYLSPSPPTSPSVFGIIHSLPLHPSLSYKRAAL